MLPTIRQLVHDIDPNVPLEKPMTQRAQFEESYAEPTMFARLGGFFGGLAALLVATGLYGTLSFRTNRRTAEIGTRMALGAQRSRVLWMIMRESLLISCSGAAIGFFLAFFCARLLKSMLYQLSPLDRVSFGLATCCVVMVGGVLPHFYLHGARPRSIPWWRCATNKVLRWTWKLCSTICATAFACW